MERGRKKRTVLRSQATRLINECQQGLQGSLAQNEARVLHARLASIQKELDIVNKEIEPLISEDDLEEEYSQVLEYKDRIVQCLARLEKQINGDPRQDSPDQATTTQVTGPTNGDGSQPTTSQRIKAKLPRTELGKFSGRRHEWQSFWELFEQMVDKNEHISTLDKFLKASLTGDAAAVLTGLPAMSRCYTDATQLLKKRFGNE
ncbi:hypothetical protein HPB48_009516 [Haemaphysalis longicornis]|uniref:Uncharacterized protein n=1 Tax=Haemaphysalis longicornis TaxID=44386 RepID=A0A9J6GFB4_HAELO|nr:hypothetical protein HPB48_009516 [Haemaphysalis longicornis]